MKWRGAFVGAASGAMGAVVASRNKGGQYLRARVVPSGRTATPAQGVIRAAIASISSAWQRLTQSQRDDWNDWAVTVPTTDALGDSIQNSGFNWFTAFNTTKAQIGQPQVSNCPTTYDLGNIDLSASVFTAGGSSGTLTFAPALSNYSLSATDFLVVYAGKPFSPGRLKYYGSFQLATTIPGNDTHAAHTFALPFSLTSSLNQMQVKVRLSRADGRLSTPALFTVSP